MPEEFFQEPLRQARPPIGWSGLGVAAVAIAFCTLSIAWIPIIGMLGVPVAFVGAVLGLAGIVVARFGASADRRVGTGLPLAGFLLCFASIGLSYLTTTNRASVRPSTGSTFDTSARDNSLHELTGSSEHPLSAAPRFPILPAAEPQRETTRPYEYLPRPTD